MIFLVIYGSLLLGITGIVAATILRIQPGFLIGSYVAASLGLLGASMTLLGKPLPDNVISRNLYDVKKARVLQFKLVEGRAIYLLIDVPGAEEPFLLTTPWSQPLAERLQQLSGSNGAGQGGNDDGSPETGTGGNGTAGDPGRAPNITVSGPFAGGLEKRPNDFQPGPPPEGRGPRKPRR